MMTTEEKRLQQELDLQQGLNKLKSSPVKSADYVSPLNNEINRVKGSIPIPSPEKIVIPGGNPHIKTNEIAGRVKGITDHINNKEIQKVTSGNAFKDKIAQILESRAAAKIGKMAGTAGSALKTASKHIPMFGGIAAGLGTALMTGDASAALPSMIPLINETDGVGTTEGTPEFDLESGKRMSDEEKEILRNRFNK